MLGRIIKNVWMFVRGRGVTPGKLFNSFDTSFSYFHPLYHNAIVSNYALPHGSSLYSILHTIATTMMQNVTAIHTAMWSYDTHREWLSHAKQKQANTAYTHKQKRQSFIPTKYTWNPSICLLIGSCRLTVARIRWQNNTLWPHTHTKIWLEIRHKHVKTWSYTISTFGNLGI